MGWLDSLLGRTRPAQSKIEKLFAMSTAQVTLATKLDARPTGRAGITFKPVSVSSFHDTETDLKALLGMASRETGTEVSFATDSLGYQWVLLQDKEFEDLVAALYTISQSLQERGFGEQLLAALFQFVDDAGHQFYWIYAYKRGNFYPFVPLPDRKRDNAYELRLQAVMEQEMPVEPELERWFPLWDTPLSPEPGRGP
ncbi:MAG: hypothetical protein M1370_07325 [Bacteroidetes bacterium]|nr:hypothetical protein [Bacteroidota bacterium]